MHVADTPRVLYVFRSPGAVLWTIQNCYNIITVIIIGAVCIQIKFVLVPVCMAYFVTFLMAPILDLFEERPFVFGSKVTDATIDLPEDKQEHDDKVVCDNMFHSTRMALPREARGGGSCKGTGVDLMLMGKLPHGLAILMTMVVWFMMMYGVMIVSLSPWPNAFAYHRPPYLSYPARARSGCACRAPRRSATVFRCIVPRRPSSNDRVSVLSRSSSRLPSTRLWRTRPRRRRWATSPWPLN